MRFFAGFDELAVAALPVVAVGDVAAGGEQVGVAFQLAGEKWARRSQVQILGRSRDRGVAEGGAEVRACKPCGVERWLRRRSEGREDRWCAEDRIGRHTPLAVDKHGGRSPGYGERVARLVGPFEDDRGGKPGGTVVVLAPT